MTNRFCSLYCLYEQIVLKKLSVYHKTEFGLESFRADVGRANTDR